MASILTVCICVGLRAENLNLEQRLSALEAESHVNGLLKQELGFLEQQHSGNLKHLESMEKELETNRQELLENRE